jgi:hypothetical protein
MCPTAIIQAGSYASHFAGFLPTVDHSSATNLPVGARPRLVLHSTENIWHSPVSHSNVCSFALASASTAHSALHFGWQIHQSLPKKGRIDCGSHIASGTAPQSDQRARRACRPPRISITRPMTPIAVAYRWKKFAEIELRRNRQNKPTPIPCTRPPAYCFVAQNGTKG